jgi:polar amino acid transport system substrate-binding protein
LKNIPKKLYSIISPFNGKVSVFPFRVGFPKISAFLFLLTTLRKVIMNTMISHCSVMRRLMIGMFVFCLLCFPTVLKADHTPNVHQGTLKRVLDTHILRVGVSLFTPWTLKNKNGKLIGFEIDVANQLAKDLGVDVELKPFDWKDIIPALQKNDIDIIVAGITITPKRALQVSFSQPYAESGIGLATNTKRTKDFTELHDLNRSTINLAAISKTVSADLVGRIFPKAKLKLYSSSKEAIQALLKGEIHGYVEHNPIPTFLAIDHPEIIDVPVSRPLLRTVAGFAIQKGNPDFINFLNAWITAHETDGWLDSAQDYWFESVDWRSEAGVVE